MKNLLKIGGPAPAFRAITFGGKIVDTSELRGRKIWLSFYCYSTCQTCTKYLADIVKYEKSILERNVSRIGVFKSPTGLITSALCGRGASTFPIIADPSEALFQLYGAQAKKGVLGSLFGGSGKKNSAGGDVNHMPAHFLIDELGILCTSFYGKTDADHIPWAVVDQFSKQPSTFKTTSNAKPSVSDEEVLDLTGTMTLDKGALKGKPQKERTLIQKIEKTATDIWRRFEGT
jgi:peroxiredoxin